MTQMTGAYDWRGRTLIGPDGERIGKVDELYEDAETHEPEWARVHTGLLGAHSSFVPLAGARPVAEDVFVDVTKEQVRSAPTFDTEGQLSREQEVELYRHYGLRYTEDGTVTAIEGGSTEGRSGRLDTARDDPGAT